MSGFWSQTNRNAAGNATATQAAPAGSANLGSLLRVQSLQAAGPAAALLQLTDSIAGVIWQIDLPAANTFCSGQIDMRASIGGSLTLAISGSSVASDVNMQGDFVPSGYPMYLP